MSVAVTVMRVPAGEAELAADRLVLAGAWALEERACDDASLVELRAVLGDDHTVVRQRLGDLPPGWVCTVEEVDDEPLDTWREFAQPVEVAPDLVLRPAWLPSRKRQGVTEVAVEPGAAFGIGDHPTTRLAAAAVWRVVREGDRVLDVGCGTGVLGIVAAIAGAQSVTAIDVAEPAVVATRANAAANRVAPRVVSSTMALADVTGAFDVVVANILAPVLIELAPDLIRTTAPSGRLIVAGVLAGGFDHVVAALAPMHVAGVEELDGWAAVELRH